MNEHENNFSKLVQSDSLLDKFKFIGKAITQVINKYPSKAIDLPTPINTVSSIVNIDEVKDIPLVVNVPNINDLTLDIPFKEKPNQFVIPNFLFTGFINKVTLNIVTGNGDEIRTISPEKLTNILEKIVLRLSETYFENLYLVYHINLDIQLDDSTKLNAILTRDIFSNNCIFTLKEVKVLKD